MVHGSYKTNCIPLAKWISSDTSSIKLMFKTNNQGTASGIDLQTKCVPNENVHSVTWSSRGLLFDADHVCSKCDLRFVIFLLTQFGSTFPYSSLSIKCSSKNKKMLVIANPCLKTPTSYLQATNGEEICELEFDGEDDKFNLVYSLDYQSEW